MSEPTLKPMAEAPTDRPVILYRPPPDMGQADTLVAAFWNADMGEWIWPDNRRSAIDFYDPDERDDLVESGNFFRAPSSEFEGWIPAPADFMGRPQPPEHASETIPAGGQRPVDYYWVKDRTDLPWRVIPWDPDAECWLFDGDEIPAQPAAVGPRIPRPDEVRRAGAAREEVAARVFADLIGTLARVEDVAARVVHADAYGRDAARQDLRAIHALANDVLKPIRDGLPIGQLAAEGADPEVDHDAA